MNFRRGLLRLYLAIYFIWFAFVSWYTFSTSERGSNINFEIYLSGIDFQFYFASILIPVLLYFLLDWVLKGFDGKK